MAVHVGLSLTWSPTLKTGFLVTRLIFFFFFFVSVTMNKLLLLINMALLLLNLFGETRAGRKCFRPRRGPRTGECVDARPYDEHGRGRCAQTPGFGCQRFNNRCRCERIIGVFMSPTRDSPEIDIDELND